MSDREIDFLKSGIPQTVPDTPKSVDTSKTAREQDEEFARDRMRKAVDIGMEVLNASKGLAIASDDVRALRVVASLVDSVSNAAGKLMQIHNPPLQKNGDQPQNERKILTDDSDDVVFLGSPAELQERLKKKK